jgi:hypothetical protein
MKDKMLKSPKAKSGKNGRYMVIPFKHNSPSSNSLSSALGSIAKLELGRAGLRNIQKTPEGNIKTGKVGEIKRPSQKGQEQLGLLESLASPNLFRQAVYGKAGSKPGAPDTYLNNLKVYQKLHTTKAGKTIVKRDIMTFRTLSENSSAGSWSHPGNKGVKIFDEAYAWAETEWENTIKPELLSLLKK